MIVVWSDSQGHVFAVDQDGNAVLITGVKGKPPTGQYKVSATYEDGYRLTVTFVMGGPKAAEKGRKTAEALMMRCVQNTLSCNVSALYLLLQGSRGGGEMRHMYCSEYKASNPVASPIILNRIRQICKQMKYEDFTETKIHVIGAEDSYGHNAAVLGPVSVNPIRIDMTRKFHMWTVPPHSLILCHSSFLVKLQCGCRPSTKRRNPCRSWLGKLHLQALAWVSGKLKTNKFWNSI